MQAVYYRKSDGSEPADQFIRALDSKVRTAIDNKIDRLNDLTPTYPHLPYPHSSQVEGELRELRCRYGQAQFRILYCRSEGLFILLHAFRKDTQKIPRREIDVAWTRWADFKTRMNAERRVPPRAAGGDAP